MPAPNHNTDRRSRFSSLINWFSSQMIAGLAFLLLLATVELFVQQHTHGVQGSIFLLLPVTWLNTTIAWLLLCPWLFLAFALLSLASMRAGKLLLQSLIFLLILLHLALNNYFSAALVPLGADLYGYSWNDIRQTVGAAGGIKWSMVAGLIVVFFILALLLRYTSKRKSSDSLLPALILTVAGLVLVITGWPGISYGSSEFTRNLVLDKTGFFLRESWKHFFPGETDTDIYADNYVGDDGMPGSIRQHHYIAETSYPFLHNDTTADVLSPFFRKSERPPNIVIILVEGLGRAFTNENAYLGNFTPFLDSLSRQSLYWDNFLSEGGRTFAVLPSLLGSLPFAKNGFLELGKDMPPTLTLVNLLQANSYHTSFYYGGDAHFDNMDLLLRSNHIDELRDGASFPAGYVKIPAENGFTWGYNDQELFRWYLNSRPVDTTAPQLNVVLTVSTHSPFHLNDPATYNSLFEARMTQLGLDEKAKQEHRLYKDQYASILYTDEALRRFFAAYAKRPDYKNTIFLITGDHRMPEIPMRDKIDRFHVPLIVYSPLLERKATFHSVSTHFDITPSLLALLSHSYHLNTPTTATWMGDGLDTSRVFQNVHSYPLIQTKTDLVDFVQGEYHLNGTSTFLLLDDLSETSISGDSIKQALSNGMANFLQRNSRWLQIGPILPDTLYRRYAK